MIILRIQDSLTTRQHDLDQMDSGNTGNPIIANAIDTSEINGEVLSAWSVALNKTLTSTRVAEASGF